MLEPFPSVRSLGVLVATETNKGVVRRFLEEGWGAGDLAVVDELIAPTAVHPYYREYPPGPEGFKHSILGPRRTLPDLRVVVEDLVAEGDRVVARYTWHGTDRGGWPETPPTGKRVTTIGMDIYRVADGQIVEYWTVLDELALRQQLGLIAEA